MTRSNCAMKYFLGVNCDSGRLCKREQLIQTCVPCTKVLVHTNYAFSLVPILALALVYNKTLLCGYLDSHLD